VLGKFGGTTSDIADAIRWSAGLPVTEAPINPNPAKVLNLSLGGGGACSATYQRAIDAVVVAGAVVVVSAGNNNSDAANSSPASCNGVITVASTDINGARSSFSNFGSTVEISAPGSGIWSTLNAGATVPAGESYASYSGTSMAAPHVAGVAALILSRYPTLTPAQVLSLIQGSAKALPSTSGCRALIGSGIVNASGALDGMFPPSVTVTVSSPASVPEDGTGRLTYTLTRSGDGASVLQPLTINFSMLGTARYSAQPGDAADYTVTGSGVSFNSTCGTGTVNFLAYVTTVQVIVSPVADQLFEPTNETVILAILPGSGYLVGTPSSATGTIISDEAIPPTYNGTSINIPSFGTANPYPSTITVSGATGQATRIRVTLYGLSHTWPNDVDILLVGPTGAETILMSDVGGSTPISNVKLTFDSVPSPSLPENGPIIGGTYQPTNIDAPSWGNPGADAFFSPAPAAPYNTGFTPFLGTNPNGVWSLYVMDDVSGDSGSISGGWSIEIFTDLTVGIYDDTHANWMYTGSWIRSSDQTGPYNQTINYSSDTSATATIQINGTAFRLRYTRFTNRGTLAVYVDGALVGSVSANGALNWQTVFERRGLSPGVHTVQIRHGGGGSVIDVDAIEVFNHIAGTGIYDDRHSNWVYSGNWSTASQDGPYDRTITFTNDVSAQASIQINGTAFRLRYTRFTNRGRLAIFVDGVQVATQVATGALSWQMVYEQTGLSPGVHTIEIQPVAGAGFIDIDAIEVFPSCLGAGIYDDRHSNWVYSGNWSTASQDGPYNRTVTLTNDMSARAAILISGTAFRLRYTRFTNRGSLAIFVDGVQVATQSATGALGWQMVYERTGLSPGDHSIEIRHGGGGSLIDIDAIEVFPSSVRTGIYDDRHSNWVYSGNWVAAASQDGPFSRTITLTNDVSARASILINGTAFRLRYTRSTDRGSLAIFVDGVQVATQSATGSTAWQMVYERNGLSAGDHSIEIRHGGGGSLIDVDAIEVFATTPVAAGIYDDRHSSWVYTGNWAAATQDGPYNRTTTYTNDASARASIQINGAGFRLRYTRFTNRGSLAIFVNGSQVASQNARGGLAWQTTYERRGLSSGVHTVEIRHGGGAGSFIDIDAIEVFPSTSLGTGVWDDRHPNWVYSGNWLTTSLEGPYNRTLTYTNDLSARASILIFGVGFRLRYTRATNRGSLAIFVDGVQVANHSAAGSMSWQMTFDERAAGLSTGGHTVEIRHGGGAGSFIDIDAIEVFPSYLSTGIYDERHSNWVYSGNWSTISQTGPYNGTITFTNDLSARVSTVFWGNRFRLRYTRFTNRGSLAIFVDGVQVATQSATGELSWQMVYERSGLNWGFHTVEIRHNGPPGSFIDIDAIQVDY
jgi:subtilisin family serine protease